MNKIGIMGGRLSSPIENEIQCFPHHNWQEEFRLAKEVGFNCIDWIVDGYEHNPIFNDELILQMKDFSQKFNVKINTICADYFLFQKIFNEKDENIKKNMDFLKRLILQAKKFEIEIIEIPFVDNSSLKTDSDKNELIENLQTISPLIKENGMKIALETDLPPRELKKFVEEIDNSNILLNYDVGNSTSLKYDIKEEWELLSEYFISVHVKDREFHGNTVPFGSGDVNFSLFFDLIKTKNYSGDLIIQGAREDLDGNVNNPLSTCDKYFKFVKQYLD